MGATGPARPTGPSGPVGATGATGATGPSVSNIGLSVLLSADQLVPGGGSNIVFDDIASLGSFVNGIAYDNTTGIATAPQDGFYLITAQMYLDSIITNLGFSVNVNGTPQRNNNYVATDITRFRSIAVTLSLSSGDLISSAINGAAVIRGSAVNPQTFMSIQYLGM